MKKTKKMKQTLKKNILMCLIGTTGKTDAIVDFIPSWIKSNPDGEMIVFDPMDRIIPTFSKKVKYSIENDVEFKWVDYLLAKYKKKGISDKPKLLVLNGGDMLFPLPLDKKFIRLGGLKLRQSPQMHSKFLNLLMMKRRLNMDIVITFQDTEAMPDRLNYFVTDYITLPVTTDYVPDEKYPNSLMIEACITAITAYHVGHNRNPSKEYLRYDVEARDVSSSLGLDKKRLGEMIEEFPKVKKLLGV